MTRVALALVCALVLVPGALAGERHPTQAELEGEVMCPVCGTTLDQSNSPAAEQIKRVIAQRIAAGDTKSDIKNRLVDEYGEAILAAPPRHGLGLLAWLLPLVGITVAAIAVGIGAWRWSHAREPASPAAQLDPALERRVDDELQRFEV
ncbi:MAG: cytochrome c-type biogenesis protein CcmH [Gaiellaceae bacterium]